jgi:hypothetical protein
LDPLQRADDRPTVVGQSSKEGRNRWSCLNGQSDLPIVNAQ